MNTYFENELNKEVVKEEETVSFVDSTNCCSYIDCENIVDDSTNDTDIIEFIKNNVQDIIDEDVEFFDMVANDVSDSLVEDSWILDDANRNAYVAIVGYAVREDKEDKLREWLPIFERNKLYTLEQSELFMLMKNSFDNFCLEKVSA